MKPPSRLPLALRVLLDPELDQSGFDDPGHIRLLLYHLSVIDAALQNLRELQQCGAQSGSSFAASILPERPYLDLLRDTLHKIQAEPEPETLNLGDLKYILHERIADLESTE